MIFTLNLANDRWPIYPHLLHLRQYDHRWPQNLKRDSSDALPQRCHHEPVHRHCQPLQYSEVGHLPGTSWPRPRQLQRRKRRNILEILKACLALVVLKTRWCWICSNHLSCTEWIGFPILQKNRFNASASASHKKNGPVFKDVKATAPSTGCLIRAFTTCNGFFWTKL